MGLDARARRVRETENKCDRRACVMDVIDTTTLALCNGDDSATEDYWPSDSVWMSFESWAFGEEMSREELDALRALPDARRVPPSLGW